MRDTDLLQTALALPAPWTVSGSRFDAAARRLDIDITFAKGARFTCPDCGAAECPVHDTEPKSWRHLNFSARGLSQRARAAHSLPELRGPAGHCAVGARRQRLHAAVRGHGHAQAAGHAGGGSGASGRRA